MESEFSGSYLSLSISSESALIRPHKKAPPSKKPMEFSFYLSWEFLVCAVCACGFTQTYTVIVKDK